MGFVRRRSVLAAVVAVVAAACLSACGSGGDSGDSSTASTSSATSSAATTPAGGAGHDRSPSSSGSPAAGQGEAGGGGGDERRGGGSPAQERRREARERVAHERRRYGPPSKQSAPFARYSGKPAKQGQPALHLAEFGQEAETGDRAEVGEALRSYLAAVHGGEWATACSYLTREVQAQLRSLAPEGGASESCAQALPKALVTFDGSTHPSPASAPDGVASLRAQRGGPSGEGAGFALFHSEGADYWVAVKREGGEWRLLSTAPQRFQ